MISRSKMSIYAQSVIFSDPNFQCSLNRRSIYNFIRPFRFISKLSYKYGLSKISYPERRFSLRIRSYSWNEYDRALDDLVIREIEPFSSHINGVNKSIGLDTYSSICYNRKNANFMNPKAGII